MLHLNNDTSHSLGRNSSFTLGVNLAIQNIVIYDIGWHVIIVCDENNYMQNSAAARIIRYRIRSCNTHVILTKSLFCAKPFNA